MTVGSFGLIDLSLSPWMLWFFRAARFIVSMRVLDPHCFLEVTYGDRYLFPFFYMSFGELYYV
jgi:hypothetical protein